MRHRLPTVWSVFSSRRWEPPAVSRRWGSQKQPRQRKRLATRNGVVLNPTRQHKTSKSILKASKQAQGDRPVGATKTQKQQQIQRKRQRDQPADDFDATRQRLAAQVRDEQPITSASSSDPPKNPPTQPRAAAAGGVATIAFVAHLKIVVAPRNRSVTERLNCLRAIRKPSWLPSVHREAIKA